MEPKVEIDDEVVKLYLEKFPGALRRNLLRAAVKVGATLERFVKTQALSGQLLNVRTGTGRRSIFHRVIEGGDDATVVVGADLDKAKYMRAQEKGAVITPKRARFLTIPLNAVKTKNGVARFTARDVISNPGSFGYIGTFVRNQVIFGKTAEGNAVPLFALKESVVLKAVGYLTGSLEEQREFISETFIEAAARTIREEEG